MSKVYNKLVRDKIPEIILKDGKSAKTRALDGPEYLEELLNKLGEECAELRTDPNVEELADVHEVLKAIAEELNIKPEELEKVRAGKAIKRGAFQKKIFLEEVE